MVLSVELNNWASEGTSSTFLIGNDIRERNND